MYREYKPTLIITHSQEDYHPDHRATSQIAEAASWFASSRGHVTAASALATPPAVWWADTLNMSSFVPEIYIDISEHVELKKKMLSSHKSQLSRGKDGDFAPLMDVMLRQCQTRGAQAGVAAAEAFRTHQAFKRIGAF
jgi:LmbE family N-acetylglucosaminyl deacetylase